MHLSKFIDYRVKAITNYRGDLKSWGNCQKHLKNHSEWRSDMKGIDDFTTAWEEVPNAFVCDGRSVWCHGAQSHFPSDCGMCENAPTKWVHLVEMDFLCFSKTPPLEVFPVPLANAPLCQCWGKWSFECGELQCDCQLSCIPRWLDCHWQWHSRWLHYSIVVVVVLWVFHGAVLQMKQCRVSGASSRLTWTSCGLKKFNLWHR